jgi:hypothetical protein
LKLRFLELAKVTFYIVLKEVNEFATPIDPLKTDFSTLTTTHFRPPRAENDFVGSGCPSKHRFLDIANVAFCASHKGENQLVGEEDPLNLNKFAFRSAQKADNEFAGPVEAYKIAFMNSPKSHFVPAKCQKMSSNGMTNL